MGIEVLVSSALCILSVIHVSGDINLFYIVMRIHHLKKIPLSLSTNIVVALECTHHKDHKMLRVMNNIESKFGKQSVNMQKTTSRQDNQGWVVH